MIDTTIIDKIIHGKIEPKIYAFHTGTIPDYLKVGDTYRPVGTRLDEWRRPGRFPDLIPLDKTWNARLDESTYFRDLEVHSFLENDKHYERLQPGQFPAAYYSREFFKGAQEQDIDEAVTDIEKAHVEHLQKYRFYSLEERHSQEYHYTRNAAYSMRPNQKKTVERFIAAKDKGSTKMLMFAVMRFGKSFTSMQCALAMQAKFVLIVSGKADVKEEWKKTVESHVDFKDYIFCTREDLERDFHIVSNRLNGDAPNGIVVFLTLQDLNGKGIKRRHVEIFKNEVDLLIVDETHFAARSEKYGRVLREENPSQEELDTVDDAEKAIKRIRAKITLHLSGTPYEILADREFEPDAIIAQYQFSDIISDRQKWDEIHSDDILKGDSDADDGKKPVYEWDNPYFGFPEMIRFAFHLNKSAREKIVQLEAEGKTTAFSELFGTYSTEEDAPNYDVFKNEREVIDFLKVIDGSESDDEVFGFLDYDKIKAGRMCRHIVMVLPYCASCDAMEKLLLTHAAEFRNLSEYNIINISGLKGSKKYADTVAIRSKISEYEAKDQKTITLTVNRMLTGSTVPEWDTMIYLKGTASPQEYDQAIFRLQSQFVKTYVDGDKSIKIDMKPQTLLVDFMPSRVFYLQGKKSGIHNANTDKFGGDELSERIQKDLQISPIITLNHNKLERVEPVDIMEAVSRYSATHSVFDEVDDIPIDYQLQKDSALSQFIQNLPNYKSKGGIQIPATPEEGGSDFDMPDDAESEPLVSSDGTTEGASTGNESSPQDDALNDKAFAAKYKTLFSNILYYAFLTPNIVNSLDQILQTIDSEENKRIAKNLGLSKSLLRAIRTKINPFILGEWDYHIFNINKLSNDPNIEPLQRAITVIGQLSKISASEVKTPENICTEMVALFPDDFLRHVAETGGRLLDIASKTAEFPLAFYKRMKNLGIADEQIQQCIYAIPTSKMTYEFTLKFFRILGLKEEHIACFTSYDLLDVSDAKDKIDYEKIAAILTQNKPFAQIRLTDDPQEGEEKVKFEAVIGNPPYQENILNTSDPSIYDKFIDIGYSISSIGCFITPAKFLFNVGKTPKQWNKRMLDDEHVRLVELEMDVGKFFPDAKFEGGVAITLRNENQTFKKIQLCTSYTELTLLAKRVINHTTFSPLSNRIFLQNKFNLKALYSEFPSLINTIGSHGKERRLTTSIFDTVPLIFTDKNERPDDVKILGLSANSRVYKYICKKYLDITTQLTQYKVVLPKSNGSGAIGKTVPTQLIGTPLILNPNEGFTQSFIGIWATNNYSDAVAAMKYIKTCFVRALLGILKVTQDNNADTWAYVPLQDFTENSDIDWSKPIPEIDQQLYRKYNLSDEEIAFIEKMIKPME